MSKLGVGVAALVIVGGGVGAFLWARSKVPDLGPAGPNRDLAPETLAAYVELPDLATTWTKMQETEAWLDLKESRIAARFMDSAPVKDLLAAVAMVSTKAEYPMDTVHAMRFLGRECSVGVQLDAQGGPAEALLLTKLDVEPLKRDLKAGDLSALWEEMQKRTSQCEFAVAQEEHRGSPVAKATRGATAFHAALLGDTLAVSTDAKLLRAAIDCRLDGGAGSLGRKPAFKNEMKALPPGTLNAWYDLEQIDQRRASLDAGLRSIGAPKETVAAIHTVLDGVKGAGAVAQEVNVPDGDLYRMTWTWSKTDALFADKATPALRDLYFGDWIGFAQVEGLGAVGEAWRKSGLKKRLSEGRLGQAVKEFFDDPSEKLGDLRSLLQRGDGPDPAEVVDAFTLTMGRRLLEDRLDDFFGGEATFGVDWTGQEADDARVALAVRLGVEGRLAVLALCGASLDGKPEVTGEDVGGRKVYTGRKSKRTLHWTLVGDAFVWGTDLEFVRRAAKTGGGEPPVPSAKVQAAVAQFKPGWRGFAWFDVARLASAVSAAAKSDRSVRQFSTVFDKMRLGSMTPDVSFATYVADDFSSIEVKSRSSIGEIEDPAMRAALSAPPREPRAWAALPESTILHVAYTGFGVETFWYAMKIGMETAGADLREFETTFREKMGMDLEKELIPALGHEIAFAVTFNATRGPAGSPSADAPPVPGVVLEIETRDPATVRRAMAKAIELAEEAMREPGKKPRKHVVREARGGVEIFKLNPPADSGVPVKPSCALIDDCLYVVSDVSVMHDLVDAKDGKAKRLVETPVFEEATNSLGRTTAQFALIDWTKLVDQIAVYTPQIADMTAGVAPPQYPDNMDDAEWQRRVAEYRRKVEEAKKTGVGTTKSWIDAMRVVEWMGMSATTDGKATESTMVVKFVK